MPTADTDLPLRPGEPFDRDFEVTSIQPPQRIDQIKFAILKATGQITIVPAVQAGRIEPTRTPAPGA